MPCLRYQSQKTAVLEPTLGKSMASAHSASQDRVKILPELQEKLEHEVQGQADKFVVVVFWLH